MCGNIISVTCVSNTTDTLYILFDLISIDVVNSVFLHYGISLLYILNYVVAYLNKVNVQRNKF